MTYGGIVQSLVMPDRNGKLGDIVLGYDYLDGYIINRGNPYFGALIGRYGNRIGGAKFRACRQDLHAGGQQWPAIRCTAASRALTRWSGRRPRPRSVPKAPGWN